MADIEQTILSNGITRQVKSENPAVFDALTPLIAEYKMTADQANYMIFEAYNHLAVGVKPDTVVEGIVYDLNKGLMQKYWPK